MSEPNIVDRKTRSGRVYTSCVAVRCQSNAIFDLDALLRSATEVEDELVGSLDSTPTPATPSMLSASLAPLATSPASLTSLNSPPNSPTSSTPLASPPTAATSSTSLGASSTSSMPSTPSARLHSLGGDHLDSSARPPRLNYQHWLRKQLYEAKISEEGHIPRQKTLKTLIPKALESAQMMDIKYIDLPVAQGAYLSKVVDGRIRDKPYTLQEAKALGLNVYKWNGVDPVPFVDKEGRVFMVLAGRPNCQDYVDACNELHNVMDLEQQKMTFTPNETEHRRGEYPIINIGVTHGLGTLQPTLLRHRTENVNRLLKDRRLQRIAVFGSAAFGLWAPRTYRYYRERLDLMYTKTGFPRIIPRSIFPALTLNFGPKVCTRKHKDLQNCPYGWCTVTALGTYDPTTGGHLIIWELGIAIEFPPGSTILLPSAALSHSNISIGADETRSSFTQYSSGGLFRWVDYGFQLEGDLKKKDRVRYEEIVKLRSGKWRVGVDMFTTIDELKPINL